MPKKCHSTEFTAKSKIPHYSWESAGMSVRRLPSTNYSPGAGIAR